MHSFSYLEPVCCSMSSSNCCFLTCIQVSQEAGQVVWYSHLFQNFPVYCDPHKGFGIINKAEIDVFLELSCFFDDSSDVTLIYITHFLVTCIRQRALISIQFKIPTIKSVIQLKETLTKGNPKICSFIHYNIGTHRSLERDSNQSYLWTFT